MIIYAVILKTLGAAFTSWAIALRLGSPSYGGISIPGHIATAGLMLTSSVMGAAAFLFASHAVVVIVSSVQYPFNVLAVDSEKIYRRKRKRSGIIGPADVVEGQLRCLVPWNEYVLGGNRDVLLSTGLLLLSAVFGSFMKSGPDPDMSWPLWSWILYYVLFMSAMIYARRFEGAYHILATGAIAGQTDIALHVFVHYLQLGDANVYVSALLVSTAIGVWWFIETQHLAERTGNTFYTLQQATIAWRLASEVSGFIIFQEWQHFDVATAVLFGCVLVFQLSGLYVIERLVANGDETRSLVCV